MIRGKRVHVFLVGQWTFFLRLQKQILPEVRHFFLFVLVIECNNVGQRSHACIWAGHQIRIQVRLQFEHENQQFRVIELAE